MDSEKLKRETFLGVVVDNKDPFRLGRCKIKVFQIFDRLETEDIPWATPWKDLNGNEFTIPEIGKIVSVVFDQGNKYTPEYIYAQNFNVNLERKLKNISVDDYQSMRAVLVDHSTQIYRTQSEGLKIDHEYTNINIDQYGNILMNLRDNKSIITLGSKDSDEEVVLGTTFMRWFDDLVSCLLGENGGAYIDKTAAPVTAGPKLTETLLKYSLLKEKFLSRHVRLPKNDLIAPQGREYINQRGDFENATRKESSPVPESTVYNPATGKNEKYNPTQTKDENPAEYNPAEDREPELQVPPLPRNSNPQQYDATPPYGNLVVAAKASIGFSTRDIPGSEGGNVGCAAAASVIFLRATGLKLVPPSKIQLGTSTVFSTLSKDTKNWRKRTDWRQAKPGDIICTARGSKAGHVGVVSDTISKDGTYVIISNSSKGFAGTAPGTIQPNYTVAKWQSITNRNPTQTAAFEYIGTFNKA